MENTVINIAIVDDHTLFRQGIGSLLSEYADINILFDAANGADLQQKLKQYPTPQVILMDITMPVMNGYDATRWVKQHYPEVRVLALSMFEEDQPIINMLKSGAGGYVLKESKAADLVHAIKTIAQHEFFLNNLVSGKLLRSIRDDKPVAETTTTLSTNETKFLQFCCTELTYKEIADKMCLSPHTIDNYREALFQKFDIKSRTGLVLFALKSGVVKV